MLAAFRQIAIQKPEHVRMLDRAHSFPSLQVFDAPPELFHFGPVNLGTEMVLGVIAIIEKKPVVNFSVTAYAPSDRLVRVRPIMPIIAIQITKTMAQIPERQEIENESPINEMNRIGRDDNRHDKKCCGECRQFETAPEIVAVVSLPEIIADRANVVPKETQKDVPPRIFRLALMAMPVDG